MKNYKEQFVQNLDEPAVWFFQAEKHRELAKLLWDEFIRRTNELEGRTANDPLVLGCHGGFLLHLGVSAENAIKAVLVSKKMHMNAVGKLAKTFAKHDLLDLCTQAKINVPTSEKEFLSRLTEYCYWAGRFSAPKTWAHMERAELAGYRSARASDLELLDELLHRLKPLAGWDENSGWPYDC